MPSSVTRVTSGASAASVESSITDTSRRAKRGRPAGDPLAKYYPKGIEWCFTFNNYHTTDPLDLCDRFGSIGATYVFQRELADSGTHHLQGVVRFSSSVSPREIFPKIMDHWKAIHWERCRSWEHSVRYCSKEDTRLPDTQPFANYEIVPVPEIYGWQSDLVDNLLPGFTPRNVYWMWEPDGGIGKSMLVRYLCMTRKALLVSGKDSDIKHGVCAWFDSAGVGPDIVIVDVPRSSVGYLSYAGIEQVANGCFFSSKYESKMCITKQPIILCFANEQPNFERMSRDRWQIYLIEASKNRCLFTPF